MAGFWNQVANVIVALISVLLILVALMFYFDHLNIEDSMEGICDGDLKILYQKECAELSRDSNFYRIAAIGTGFGGLLGLVAVMMSKD